MRLAFTPSHKSTDSTHAVETSIDEEVVRQPRSMKLRATVFKEPQDSCHMYRVPRLGFAGQTTLLNSEQGVRKTEYVS